MSFKVVFKTKHNIFFRRFFRVDKIEDKGDFWYLTLSKLFGREREAWIPKADTIMKIVHKK